MLAGSAILGDDAELAIIFSVDQRWIVRDWMPRANSAGLKVAASNKPRGHHGQASVNRIRSVLQADLAIGTFESVDEAKHWLRSVYQASTYKIVYLGFKSGGDPINSFAFWSPEPSLARVALRAFWKVDDQMLTPLKTGARSMPAITSIIPAGASLRRPLRFG